MSYYRLLYLLILLLPATPATAQATLDGSWEGFMMVGGIYSGEELPMQLYLTTEGRVVTGRSYVQLPDGSTLRMDLKGRLHGDMSLTLIETGFGGDPNNDVMPEFARQYQIIFKPDLWDARLRGYWQEQTKEVFGPDRRRGRMRLKRQAVKGA